MPPDAEAAAAAESAAALRKPSPPTAPRSSDRTSGTMPPIHRFYHRSTATLRSSVEASFGGRAARLLMNALRFAGLELERDATVTRIKLDNDLVDESKLTFD